MWTDRNLKEIRLISCFSIWLCTSDGKMFSLVCLCVYVAIFTYTVETPPFSWVSGVGIDSMYFTMKTNRNYKFYIKEREHMYAIPYMFYACMFLHDAWHIKWMIQCIGHIRHFFLSPLCRNALASLSDEKQIFQHHQKRDENWQWWWVSL